MKNMQQLLEQLTFSEEQIERLQERFGQVLTGKDIWQSATLTSDLKNSAGKAGIYFWVLANQGNLHRIYVGKTNSLGHRIRNYASAFQPHSPNDFKLQVFFAFIQELIPASELALWFSPCDVFALTQREKEEISFFLPLLNRRMKSSTAARLNLQEAFIAYYESCFVAEMDGGQQSKQY